MLAYLNIKTAQTLILFYNLFLSFAACSCIYPKSSRCLHSVALQQWFPTRDAEGCCKLIRFLIHH